MAEYKTSKQVNYGFGLSFEATGKAPVIAKRIWATLADAQAYVNSATDTATKGLILTVVNDAENNGVYFVKKAAGDGADETSGTLQKISGNNDFSTIEEIISSHALAIKTIQGGDTKISMRQVAEDVRSQLSLAYDSTTKKIDLKVGDVTITSLDATAFIKDGMLAGTVLYQATAATGTVTIAGKQYSLTGLTAGHKYIVLAFNGDGPTAPITLDVNELVDVYTAGTGLLLDAKTNQFSVDQTTINNWIESNSYVITTRSLIVHLNNAVVNEATINGQKLVESADGTTPVGKGVVLDGSNVKTKTAITTTSINIVANTAIDSAINTVATKTQEALNVARTALQTIEAGGDEYISATTETKSGTSQRINVVISASKDISQNDTTGEYVADAAAVKTYVNDRISAATLTWGSWS